MGSHSTPVREHTRCYIGTLFARDQDAKESGDLQWGAALSLLPRRILLDEARVLQLGERVGEPTQRPIVGPCDLKE